MTATKSGPILCDVGYGWLDAQYDQVVAHASARARATCLRHPPVPRVEERELEEEEEQGELGWGPPFDGLVVQRDEAATPCQG
jgi:hypothetical protein